MPEEGPLLAVLIVERPLCVDCISEKSGLPTDQIEPFLTRIESKVPLSRGENRCRACGRFMNVSWIVRQNERD
jgi:hypothetical protein